MIGNNPPLARSAVACIEFAVLGTASVFALVPALCEFAEEIIHGDELNGAVKMALVIAAERFEPLGAMQAGLNRKGRHPSVGGAGVALDAG